MSRSYRKPWVNDTYKGSQYKQFSKRASNKRVRKAEDISDGKAYRKLFNPWDINDYRFMVSKSDEYWGENFWRFIRK